MDNRENIELIKEKIDIVSLIGRYVKLKQAGKNFVGLCPFHTEKTPSFNVSPDINFYKCFGCGKSGDVFSFIQEIEHIEFSEALNKLAKETGVTLEITHKSESPLQQINKWAAINYQKELRKPENKFALDYLLKRGITEELIKSFEIGYAPGDGSFLKRLQNYKNFSKKVLLDSGLFIENNGSVKEKFKKRILFPIHSISGSIIAFTGRLLPGNEYGPKYLNTGETPLYKKRSSLYGIYKAKSYIRKEDLCILLEGQTDVIALNKVDIKNCVAPLGTGLTITQLEILSKYTKNFLFIFDNDIAGQKALEKSFELTSQLNLNSYAINTGKYKDVDEMAQDNPKELIKKIDQRVDTFTYLVSSKVESLDLSKLGNTLKLSSYISKLLELVKDEDSKKFFENQTKKIVGDQINIVPDNFKKPSISTNSDKLTTRTTDNVEDSLLAYIIRNKDLNSSPIYSPDIFINPLNKEIATYIINNPNTSPQELPLAFPHSEQLKDWAERLLMKETENLEVEKLLKRIYTVYLNRQMRQLRIQLAAAEEKEDQEAIEKLVSEVQEITDKLKKIKYEN